MVAGGKYSNIGFQGAFGMWFQVVRAVSEGDGLSYFKKEIFWVSPLLESLE